MKDADDVFDLASLAVVHDEANAFDAVVPPIVQTSLFTFSSYAEMEETYRGLKVRPTYSRGLNPTVRIFEEKMAELEGAEDALGFGSGMAAISSTVLDLREAGRPHPVRQALLSRHLSALPDAAASASASPSTMSTAATRPRSRRRCPAPRSSTWRARPAGSSRPTTSARWRRSPSAHGVLTDHRQQLGDAGLPAADHPGRRPRPAFGLEISRRPHRRGGGRGRRHRRR